MPKNPQTGGAYKQHIAQYILISEHMRPVGPNNLNIKLDFILLVAITHRARLAAYPGVNSTGCNIKAFQSHILE